MVTLDRIRLTGLLKGSPAFRGFPISGPSPSAFRYEIPFAGWEAAADRLGNPVARDRRITGRPTTVLRRSHVRSTNRPGRKRVRARIRLRLRHGSLREETAVAAAAAAGR